MPTDRAVSVLVLGGTSEANALVRELALLDPRPRIVLSLAGRTREPRLPKGAIVRVGGFGGVEGLQRFLRGEAIDILIDATHPFAARIASHALKAARAAGVPIAKLLRPPWVRRAGDIWVSVGDEYEACRALPSGARPFIALGSQHLGSFAGRGDILPVLRMIEPAPNPVSGKAEIIYARPHREVEAEAELFAARRITHLVCRNSGGEAAYAKIAAARKLHLPVVMIERLPADEGAGPVFADLSSVIRWFGENKARV